MDDATPLVAAIEGGGVAASDDAGASWAAANVGLPTTRVSVLARDPSTPGRVYAAGGGVFRSDDGGHGWTTVAATFDVGPAALVVDAADPDVLYAGTVLGGVLRSTDGGASWTAFAVGLPPARVASLAVDPAATNVVHAGTRGVWDFTPGCLETCGVCEQCDGLAGCVGRPRPDCRAPIVTSAADLTIVNKVRDTSDAFSWRWQKGSATPVTAFGDPVTTDPYTLCVFDESTATPRLLLGVKIPAGGICGRKSCWSGIGRPKGSKGFRYADSKGTVNGITAITLAPGITGKAKISVRGKGARLGLPPLPAPIPLRVQLGPASGACFDARYAPGGVRKNDTSRFRGKSVTP
jgi:hypothetical protein